MTPPRWKGWGEEPRQRRRDFVASLGVLAAITLAAVAGTIRGEGLADPLLWLGLALVPVLLYLVRRAGLS